MLLLFEQGEEFGPLIGRGWAAERAAKSVGDAVCVGTAALPESFTGERLGTLDELGLVQRDQRLQRSIGAEAADAGEIGIGGIEGLQHGIGGGAELEDEEAAAITLRARFLAPGFRAVTRWAVEQELRCGRVDAAPANLRVKQAAGL